ncbi:MAG TPA: histidine phosphatase family protein [Actinomycetota bacterium]|jgi:broad specificity phosphatase PhoE|nr:histidine phosphatase family protein [Actinomycetota bacterium]
MPYLVRHAHAGDKRTWTGPDSLRPLSPSGRREAHGLLTQLRDYRITRIMSSPAARCLQTVEPLARRRGLPIEPADVLGVDADPAELLALLLDPAAGEAVVCSHGELIGAVLTRLLGQDLDDSQLSWPKASTWVLDVEAGQVHQTHYLPPLLPPLRLQDAKASYY